MPELRFASDPTKKVLLDDLGFRTEWINETISQHDKIEILEHGDLVLKAHAKRLGGRKPSWFVVVTEPGKGIIETALRLYHDFDQDLNELTPLGLVEAVANRFGPDLQVGEVKGRFFLTQDIPAPTTGESNLIGVIKGPSRVYVWSRVRLSEGTPRIATCSLVFGLDVLKYRDYLRRWGQ